jgi:hypothetical protein
VPREFKAVAAEFQIRVAWMHLDVADQAGARAAARDAFRLAQESGDLAACSWTMAMNALLETWLGNTTAARAYGLAAVGLANDGPRLVQAFAQGKLARALAAAGDSDGTLAALSQARALFDSARPGEDELVPETIRDSYSDAYVLDEEGHCFRDLRKDRLLRMHSNTVFYLPASNAVARINSGADGAQRVGASLTATRWLARQGFATVRPKVDRAIVHGGLVISFWEYEETVSADRSLSVLAGLLRELHSFKEVEFELSPMPGPLGSVAVALDDYPDALDHDDRSWLSDEISQCEQRWTGMRFVLPAGLVHGDAHPNNLLYARRGVLLGDWDHVGYGPREWDLVQALYFHRRFPARADDLDAAAHTYGWDLRVWPGVEDLIGIREVSGLGSYIRTAAAKPNARAELVYRIKTLREHDTTAPWNSPSRS